MLMLALFGTHDLLSIHRPKRFATDNAILLPEGMITLFSMALGFDSFSLGCVQALFTAVFLLIAIWPKFLTTMLTDTLRKLVSFTLIIAFLLLALVIEITTFFLLI